MRDVAEQLTVEGPTDLIGYCSDLLACDPIGDPSGVDESTTLDRKKLCPDERTKPVACYLCEACALRAELTRGSYGE